MYFGSQEIESVDNNTVTLKNGFVIEVTDKNKELFTEEPLGGSELQHKWATMVAKDVIDVLHTNNVRLTDINLVMNIVQDTISGKNDEAIATAFGREKLNTLSEIFGATENLASLSVRNIQMKDIFNS